MRRSVAEISSTKFIMRMASPEITITLLVSSDIEDELSILRVMAGFVQRGRILVVVQFES
jgi:hypothetical protein